jgi:hypothetical protein
VQVHYTLSPEAKRALEKLARRERMSASQMVESLVWLRVHQVEKLRYPMGDEP